MQVKKVPLEEHVLAELERCAEAVGLKLIPYIKLVLGQHAMQQAAAKKNAPPVA